MQKKLAWNFSHEITTGIANTVLAKTTGLADRLSEKTTIIEENYLVLFNGFEDITALEDKRV